MFCGQRHGRIPRAAQRCGASRRMALRRCVGERLEESGRDGNVIDGSSGRLGVLGNRGSGTAIGTGCGRVDDASQQARSESGERIRGRRASFATAWAAGSKLALGLERIAAARFGRLHRVVGVTTRVRVCVAFRVRGVGGLFGAPTDARRGTDPQVDCKKRHRKRPHRRKRAESPRFDQAGQITRFRHNMIGVASAQILRRWHSG